jgi:hypothetical protein
LVNDYIFHRKNILLNINADSNVIELRLKILILPKAGIMNWESLAQKILSLLVVGYVGVWVFTYSYLGAFGATWYMSDLNVMEMLNVSGILLTFYLACVLIYSLMIDFVKEGHFNHPIKRLATWGIISLLIILNTTASYTYLFSLAFSDFTMMIWAMFICTLCFQLIILFQFLNARKVRNIYWAMQICVTILVTAPSGLGLTCAQMSITNDPPRVFFEENEFKLIFYKQGASLLLNALSGDLVVKNISDQMVNVKKERAQKKD